MSETPNNNGDSQKVQVTQNQIEAVKISSTVGSIELVNGHRPNGRDNELFEYIPVFKLPLTPAIHSNKEIVPAVNSLAIMYNNIASIPQINVVEFSKKLISANKILRMAEPGLSQKGYNRKLESSGITVLRTTFSGERMVEALVALINHTPLGLIGRYTPRFIERDFISDAMGKNIATLTDIKNFIYHSISNVPSSSLPGEIIIINRKSVSYSPNHKITDVGRIGLEMHELWHQVQYKEKREGDEPFLQLMYEQLSYYCKNKDVCEEHDICGYDIYDVGNPTLNAFSWDRISKLSDIPTLEGQAQFVGQWAADLYSKRYRYWKKFNAEVKYYKENLAERLVRMAEILYNSGYKSRYIDDYRLQRINDVLEGMDMI